MNLVRRWSERHLVLCLMGTLILVSCGGGAGTGGGGAGGTGGSGTGGSVSMSAPTDLLYHIGNTQGAISVWMNVGAPFVLDSPTVTGTVTGYSRPAGVIL